MKTIAVLSDTHIEISKFKPTWPEADYIAFCGDIGVGMSARPLIEAACKRYGHVFLVAGNHCYYGKVIEDIDSKWYALEDNLANFTYAGTMARAKTVDNRLFILGTMWTDLSDLVNSTMAEMQMNDYRKIFHVHGEGRRRQFVNGIAKPTRTISTKETTQWFKDFEEVLEAHKDVPNKVVLTHHSPTELGISEEHTGDALSPAYFTDMSKYFNSIDLWAFGHVHKHVDARVGNCRLVSNPRGYVFGSKQEIPGPFKIEVYEI